MVDYDYAFHLSKDTKKIKIELDLGFRAFTRTVKASLSINQCKQTRCYINFFLSISFSLECNSMYQPQICYINTNKCLEGLV